MASKIAGIDVHKKGLVVVCGASEPEWNPQRCDEGLKFLHFPGARASSPQKSAEKRLEAPTPAWSALCRAACENVETQDPLR